MGDKEERPGGVRRVSLQSRPSKVRVRDFARPYTPGQSLKEFIEALPRILGAEDLRSIAERIVRAHLSGKEVIAAMGAHVIKVGLSPVIIALMERKVITAVALNGAGVIHDVEIALSGQTSEDVGPALDRGMFGMVEETARFINEAVRDAGCSGSGFGPAVCARLAAASPAYAAQSILCQAHTLGIPVTVHVALGTDIVHMHPSAEGSAIGAASLLDFHRLADIVARLAGGVFLNIGSAVILPEVFVKALNLARNRGHAVKDFTTVNMDFIRHYRPSVNVVERPVRLGGEGFHLIGHHEINVPLLAAAVLEHLNDYAKT